MTELRPVGASSDITADLGTYAKPWYLSKTIIGVLVAMLTPVLAKYGLPLTADMQPQIVDAIVTALTAVGGGLAIYGRMAATTAIGTTAKPQKTTLPTILAVLCLTASVSACASLEAQSPSQMVYAVKADFAACLPAIKVYVSDPAVDPEHKERIKQLVSKAHELLDTAEIAVRGGQSVSAVTSAVTAAQEAVKALKSAFGTKG